MENRIDDEIRQGLQGIIDAGVSISPKIYSKKKLKEMGVKMEIKVNPEFQTKNDSDTVFKIFQGKISLSNDHVRILLEKRDVEAMLKLLIVDEIMNRKNSVLEKENISLSNENKNLSRRLKFLESGK